MRVMALFQLHFFAKYLCAGEDGPWAGTSVSYWHISSCFFFVVFVLFFNTVKIMLSWSVNLLALFLGSLSPLTCAHTLASNWQLPFFNQQKGENGHRNDFISAIRCNTDCSMALNFVKTFLFALITLVLLYPDMPAFANSVDSYQLASEEASRSGSVPFVIT